MAWTKKQAECIALQQTAELKAQGPFDVVMFPKFVPEAGGWVVEGTFKADLDSDPIWGPIARELGLLGLLEGEE